MSEKAKNIKIVKTFLAALVGTALSFYERDDTAGFDVDEDHAHVKLGILIPFFSS